MRGIWHQAGGFASKILARCRWWSPNPVTRELHVQVSIILLAAPVQEPRAAHFGADCLQAAQDPRAVEFFCVG